jgi:ERCC4-related helicase
MKITIENLTAKANNNYFPSKKYKNICADLESLDDISFKEGDTDNVVHFIKKFFKEKKSDQIIILTKFIHSYVNQKEDLKEAQEQNFILTKKFLEQAQEQSISVTTENVTSPDFITLPIIKEVTLVNNTLTALFKDGDTTTSTCMKCDTFDYEKGLLLCVLRKILGEKNFKKLYYRNIFKLTKKYNQSQSEDDETERCNIDLFE